MISMSPRSSEASSARVDRSADTAAESERTPSWDGERVSLLELHRRVISDSELCSVLRSIVDRARSTTEADVGVFILEFRGSLSFGLDERELLQPEHAVSRSVVRWTLGQGRSLRAPKPREGTASARPSSTPSVVCSPFQLDGELRGALYLQRDPGHAFAPEAEALVALLAEQAGLAIRQRRCAGELAQLMRSPSSDPRAFPAPPETRRTRTATALDKLLGESELMHAARQLIRQAAPSTLPVLVSGASGTGKELAARALHDSSPRADGPFVAENCASLPGSLAESELFGFRKGSFTGAERDQPGLFERADGGTLFLDEIGELPLELQAKLLRVLESYEVRRLGACEPRRMDFRLVTATNRDLKQRVRERRFRADLYYRLAALEIRMPSLAERREDIPLLAQHFLDREVARSAQSRRLAPDALARLCQRTWPGNVRELANEIARLCVLSEHEVVESSLIRAPVSLTDTTPTVPTLAEVERGAIEAALRATEGNRARAAELLGISRAKIFQRLKDWREAGPVPGGPESLPT